MRSAFALPKSLLALEVIGIALLGLAWLSINHYLALPAPFDTSTAAVLMVFAGIALMIPAALALMMAMSRRLAPLLNHDTQQKTSPDKDKRDDADH
nr:YbjC family protein [Entomohabitans teleogrylli]